MAWLLVLVSGFLEVGWAVGLKLSHGLTRPVPAALTIAGVIASFAMLTVAVRELPIGTAYAVWVGIGTVGTAIVGVVWLGEPFTVPRMLCMLLVIGGLAGLKLTS